MERSVTRLALTLSAAFSLATAVAQAQEPVPFSGLDRSDRATEGEDPPSATEPAYFNGIGTPRRSWELQADAAFSTSRVATGRLELGHAFTLDLLSIVVRVDVATDTNTLDGVYAIHGPIPSLGLRARTRDANEWIEVGLRLLPTWKGPNDTDPSALNLSLGASLASGSADDARWLSFSRVGWQLYGAIQARTSNLLPPSLGTLFLGSLYGGDISLSPLEVRSWLGPQNGLIGNAFVELFVGFPCLGAWRAQMQAGVHADASLSSIWPGSDLFPYEANVFVGWSPVPWFAARAFGGLAGAVGSNAIPGSNPYGIRLIAYFQ